MPFKRIAEQLGLAPDTVKKAFAVMYKKMNVSSRKELLKELAKLGLADMPAPPPRPPRPAGLPALKKRKKPKRVRKIKKVKVDDDDN